MDSLNLCQISSQTNELPIVRQNAISLLQGIVSFHLRPEGKFKDLREVGS